MPLISVQPCISHSLQVGSDVLNSPGPIREWANLGDHKTEGFRLGFSTGYLALN